MVKQFSSTYCNNIPLASVLFHELQHFSVASLGCSSGVPAESIWGQQFCTGYRKVRISNWLIVKYRKSASAMTYSRGDLTRLKYDHRDLTKNITNISMKGIPWICEGLKGEIEKFSRAFPQTPSTSAIDTPLLDSYLKFLHISLLSYIFYVFIL